MFWGSGLDGSRGLRVPGRKEKHILNIREKHCLLTLESLFDDLGGAGRFGNERSIHWICWISLQYPCCGSIGQPRIA